MRLETVVEFCHCQECILIIDAFSAKNTDTQELELILNTNIYHQPH